MAQLFLRHGVTKVLMFVSFFPAMENLTPVTLVVKAPNQKIADQTIECALDWTVKKLKEHLSSVYPSKPVSSLQQSVSFIVYHDKSLMPS